MRVDLDRRRGAALFVVLLFSAFLAALAASAMRMSLSGARAAAVFADAIRADELGRSAADILAYRLATAETAAKRGGTVAVRLPGADVTIDYLSESARLDVNRTPEPLIAALLTALGAEPAEADAAVAKITRFRAEAARRKAEATTAQGAAPAPGGLAAIQASLDSIGPAHKPQAVDQPLAIRDISEVAQAWGLSDTLTHKMLPFLTVSNGAPTVDPILVGRPILVALLGGDERADDYVKRRRQGFIDKDSALELLPVPARDFVDFTDSLAVHAVARVRLADLFERRYDMILAPAASAASSAPAQPAAPAGFPPVGLTPAGVAPTRTATDPVGIAVVVAWRKLP